MKLTTKIVAGAAVLALLSMTTGSLQAQTTNVITITISALAQSGSSTNGAIITTASPSKHTLATKDILSALAQDENAEGNYGFTTFPTGAKLVVLTGDNPAFQVLAANNSLLVDVSDIITADDGTNDITSGKQSNLTGLAATSETDLHVLKIQYDDSNEDVITNSVLGLTFKMTGLMTSTTTDTAPTVAHVYTESQTDKLASGVGEGFYQGQPFVLTGTLSASGKATLTLVP